MVHMILLFGSLALGGMFLWLYIWAVRGGQFEDPEEAKYLMFREDDDSDSVPSESSEGESDGRRAEKEAD
jgi:cbb3-type cytochrome oxidase maturation protein